MLRDQKWGMDLLGISGFFSQRTHTRNFCGSHPRVTFLATHKVFLFSSQYSDSLAILCCAYRTSYTTPTEACCPGDARISQSKEVKISCPPASEHPSQSVTLPIAGNEAAPASVDIDAIVFEAVLGGLQAAGILSQAQKEPDGSNATTAAAVEGSVVAVIQDITGCNFKHECFRCGSHHPANQCHFPKQQANSTKAVSRPKSTAVTASNSAPTSRTVSSKFFSKRVMNWAFQWLPRKQ